MSLPGSPRPQRRRVRRVAGAVAFAAVALVVVLALAFSPEDVAPENGDGASPVYPVIGIAHVQGEPGGALPVVPLSVDPDGYLVGEPVAEFHQREAVLAREFPTYDVLAWFRYCMPDGSPALAPGFDADHHLRYAAPAHGDAWYADRVGERVHVTDVPEGGYARVTWRSHEYQDPHRITLLVAHVNASVPDAPDSAGPFTPQARNFAQGGFIAFSDRSTHDCAPVAPWPDVDGGRDVVGDAADPLLVVDAAHGSAWNPHAVARDVVDRHGVGPTGRPNPLPEAPADKYATGCDARLTHGVYLGNRPFVDVAAGGNVTEAFTLTTRDAAFRNLTWHAFLTPADAEGARWADRVLDARLDGPATVRDDATVVVNVTVPAPAEPGTYRLGVAWEGDVRACDGPWRAFPGDAVVHHAGTPVRVNAEDART